MEIGIYGGSFNPVHFGHVGLAKWVAEHCGLDALWIMVSPSNPLKNSKILADEQERLAGARKAFAGIAGVEVSDFEFGLPRPSYTAATLRALAQAYPEDRFSLVIGEDNLAVFDRWREWEYILGHFRVLVYPRHGAAVSAVGEACRAAIAAAEQAGRLVRLDAPYFDISSTEIREKNAKTCCTTHS